MMAGFEILQGTPAAVAPLVWVVVPLSLLETLGRVWVVPFSWVRMVALALMLHRPLMWTTMKRVWAPWLVILVRVVAGVLMALMMVPRLVLVRLCVQDVVLLWRWLFWLSLRQMRWPWVWVGASVEDCFQSCLPMKEKEKKGGVRGRMNIPKIDNVEMLFFTDDEADDIAFIVYVRVCVCVYEREIEK